MDHRPTNKLLSFAFGLVRPKQAAPISLRLIGFVAF
jgi:hypothetical protein